MIINSLNIVQRASCSSPFPKSITCKLNQCQDIAELQNNRIRASTKETISKILLTFKKTMLRGKIKIMNKEILTMGAIRLNSSRLVQARLNCTIKMTKMSINIYKIDQILMIHFLITNKNTPVAFLLELGKLTRKKTQLAHLKKLNLLD